MTEYALLIDNAFREIRRYDEQPADIPHKGVRWLAVSRVYGSPFEGEENGMWVIRTVDPSTLPPPVPAFITRRQCSLQLLASNMISGVEAIAMAQSGVPPASIAGYFDAMAEPARTHAYIDFAAMNYYRDNPLITDLMIANGLNDQQIDQFFIAAAQL